MQLFGVPSGEIKLNLEAIVSDLGLKCMIHPEATNQAKQSKNLEIFARRDMKQLKQFISVVFL